MVLNHAVIYRNLTLSFENVYCACHPGWPRCLQRMVPRPVLAPIFANMEHLRRLCLHVSAKQLQKIP
jgi:hypothetical protein